MAQSFEQTSKQQASDIEQALQSDYKRLRESSAKASKESAASIRSDFQDLSRSLSGLALRSWLWMVLTITLIGVTSYGALWWTGQQIAANLATIQNQERAIKQRKAEGGALKWSKCDGRLCVKIDPEAPQYQEGYRIPEGY